MIRRSRQHTRGRRAGILLAGLALTAGLAACATLMFGPTRTTIHFSHKKHLDLDIECSICHANIASSTTDLGHDLPPEETCLFCHVTWKDDNQCERCHVDPQHPVTYVPQEAEFINFSHARHLPLVDGDCAVCHAGVASSRRASDRNLPEMQVCLDCHNHDQGFNELECIECHRSLRNTDWRPLSRFDHGPDWMKRHSITGRERADLCAQCHDANYCADCHLLNDVFAPSVVYPENVDANYIHRDGWLSRHGLDARFEQDSCIRCHSSTFCRDCHHAVGLVPMQRFAEDGIYDNPHPPGWSTLHGRHARREIQVCASCHSGQADSICIDCHATGGFNPHPPGFSSSLSRTHDRVCRICHEP